MNQPDSPILALVTTLAAATPTQVFDTNIALGNTQNLAMGALNAGFGANLSAGWSGTRPFNWLLAKGVLYLTNGATAGTIQVFLAQGTTNIGVPLIGATNTITVQANEVKQVGFDLALNVAQGAPINWSFGGPFANFGVAATASQAATGVGGICRIWTV